MNAALIFAAVAAIVEKFQSAISTDATPALDVAGLIYAAAHGLIDLEASGRMREQNGLKDADQGVTTSGSPLVESFLRWSGLAAKCTPILIRLKNRWWG